MSPASPIFLDRSLTHCCGPPCRFPIRLIVPGQIGGRSVKWLNKIEVSAQESQHYLHFWDNKLLPTQLEPDVAKKEKHWWYDPKYIINELNVNVSCRLFSLRSLRAAESNCVHLSRPLPNLPTTKFLT